MHIDLNGTRLWFDVDGPSLVPEGGEMRGRSTVVLLHGGPGSFDHSYFKPDFARLAAEAQVVYLDLRDHGRSAWGDPADWSFEICADDVRAFCDILGVVKPVVLGHSLGGFVAMLYAARHPGHAGGLVLQSTLVCVGSLDPITPVAASREIVEALPAGIGRLEVIEGAGHFTWRDKPDIYWTILTEFVRGGSSTLQSTHG